MNDLGHAQQVVNGNEADIIWNIACGTTWMALGTYGIQFAHVAWVLARSGVLSIATFILCCSKHIFLVFTRARLLALSWILFVPCSYLPHALCLGSYILNHAVQFEMEGSI